MNSIKIIFILWIVGGLIISIYQTNFLHNAGIENIPPELYGEIFGKVLVWCLVALPFLHLYLKKSKKGDK